jgi:predicted DNA-binding transcriptional regulator AlpA
MTMSEPLPSIIASRGLNIKQASAYWGVSPGTFKKLVTQGIAPPPIRLGTKGKQIFDRQALDAAMDARSIRAEVA